MNYKNTKGFSLIEISMVLLVTAFLLVGVNYYKSYQRNADILKIANDVHNLSFAVSEFKKTYNALPGDFLSADTVLGATAAQVGNGNDYIDNASIEPVLSLLHLNLAGMISGNFQGNWVITANKNNFMPTTRSDLNYYLASISRAAAGAATVFDGTTYETIIVGAGVYDTNANGSYDWYSEAAYPTLRSTDMAAFDIKFDDGYPTTGKVIAADATGVTVGNCVNTTPTPYAYAATSTPACYFAVKIEQKF